MGTSRQGAIAGGTPRKPYRVQRTLSDLNGYDPYIHGGTAEGAIAVLFDILDSERAPQPDHVAVVARALGQAARDFKAEHATDTVFRTAVFRKLVATATALSEVALGRAEG